MKKYEAPVVVVLGTVEEMTQTGLNGPSILKVSVSISYSA